MKILLDETDLRLMARIKDIIGKISIDTDGYIEKDELLGVLWDLTDAYDDETYKVEELELKIEENYKPCDSSDNWRFYSHQIKALQDEINKRGDFIEEKGLAEEYGRYEG